MSEELKSEMAKDDENIVRFQTAEILFKEGDKGGDIFLIEMGEVEIFREKKGVSVALATMGKGELLGLFTCLNEKPRTAGAIAKTAVRCKIIKHERIAQAIRGMPKWFMIILKEYGNRLQEIEDQFMASHLQLEENKTKMMTPLVDGKMFCSCIARLSEFCSIKVEGKDFVLIDNIYQLMAETLGTTKAKIATLGEIFIEAGLLRKDIEPDKKREVFPKADTEQIVDFILFLAKAKDNGKSKKMVDARWPTKAIKVGRALVAYAKAKKKTAPDTSIPVAELETHLSKTTGAAYEEEAIAFLATFLLVKKIDPAGQPEAIVFNPQKLGRSIAHVLCYQRLAKLEYKDEAVSGAA